MIYAPMPEKRCARCKSYLPITLFSIDRSKRSKRVSSCRDCRKLREPEPEVLPFGTRRCRRCKAIVTFENLVKDKNGRDSVDTICIKCNREHVKEYRQANPEYAQRGLVRVKDWGNKHPERASQAGADWRRRNRSHVNELQRERRTKRREQHPELFKRRLRVTPEERRLVKQMAQARRRAREFTLPYDWTLDDWIHARQYWNGCCAVCGSPVGFWLRIVQDHWIALSDPRPDNPGTVPWNILPLCHSHGHRVGGCNNAKQNHDPIEWLTEKLGPRKARKKLAEIEAYFESVRR